MVMGAEKTLQQRRVHFVKLRKPGIPEEIMISVNSRLSHQRCFASMPRQGGCTANKRSTIVGE
jgi:hypothetical protein